MASTLVGITILLTAAWFLTALLKRHSAALRHVIWTCAIAATLLYAPLRWRAPRRVISRPLPAIFTPAVVVGAPAEATAVSLTEIAAIFWALGSALLALRLLARAVQFRRLVVDATPVESAGPVRVLTSPRIPGPLVTGILRPAILLPDDSAQWTPSRRRAVMAHELAHIRRRDPAILLAAHLATIVYWFHPLCWLAAARLRMESERACDDAALRIGLLPSGYAGHLLDLARLFNPQPAIPMATTSHLESRVKSILDPFMNRSFAARRTWLAAALITAAVTGPLTVLSLHAQQSSGGGTIAGNISDPTGAVVARVQVIAFNTETHKSEITSSDAIGGFTFANIPAGDYSLEARVPGFATAHVDNLPLVNGGTLHTAIKLAVGRVNENITVVAAGTPQLPAVAPARPARPIRVGGNVQIANLLQRVEPVYPAQLKAAGIQGTVMLEAVISKEGAPASLTARNTAVDPAFVSAAVDAVSQWRYRPTLLNGEPIEVMTNITIDFKLQ